MFKRTVERTAEKWNFNEYTGVNTILHAFWGGRLFNKGPYRETLLGGRGFSIFDGKIWVPLGALAESMYPPLMIDKI